MGEPGTRVVVVVLDAFPARHLSPSVTPTLWELSAATRGLWDHGWAGMTAMTYSSHSSILTGATGDVHGVPMNEALVGGRPTKLTDGWLAAPTFFGAVAGGRRTAAVCGDQHVAQLVLTEGAAGRVWPAGGVHTEGIATDGIGDAFDDGVADEALRVLAEDDPDLLFVHLNDTDLWGHMHGPEHPEAEARRAAADRHVGRLVDALASSPRWSATTLFVLSDHDMLAVAPEARVDLPAAFAAAGLDGLTVLVDGGAATVWLEDAETGVLAEARAAALAEPGVAEAWFPQRRPCLDEGACVAVARPDWGCASDRLGDLLVVCDERHAFVEPQGFDLPGVHGQPAARACLAVVAGGDERLRRATDAAPLPVGRWPTTLDWAPTICALFGVAPPAAATGRPLVEVFEEGALTPSASP